VLGATVCGLGAAGLQYAFELFGADLLAWIYASALKAQQAGVPFPMQLAALVLTAVNLLLPSPRVWLRSIGMFVSFITLSLGASLGDVTCMALGQALFASLGLAWVREPAGTSIAMRAALAPGHPWLNLGAFLGYYGLILAASFPTIGSTTGSFTDDASQWLVREPFCLLASASLAVFVAVRLVRSGALGKQTAWRMGARFLCGQMLVSGLLVGTCRLLTLEYSAFTCVDERVLGGMAFTFLPFVASLRRRRIAWICLPLLLGAEALAPALLLVLAALLPWRLGLVALVGQQATWKRLWLPALWSRLPLLLLAAGFIVTMGSWQDLIDVLNALSRSEGLPFFLMAVAWEYPMLLMAARRVHPFLASQGGGGLWWCCLLLLPCWIGFYDAGISVGPFGTLAIPIAAWIAARHGRRALPAIALALLPMVLNFQTGALTLGGSSGTLLAALLVARLVADDDLRAACFSATRFGRWQLWGLLLLPVQFTTPGIGGLSSTLGGGLLPWIVIALALLARAPVAQLLAMSMASSLIGFAFASVVALNSGIEDFRMWRLGLPNLPSAMVTLGLLYVCMKALRWPRMLESLQDFLDDARSGIAALESRDGLRPMARQFLRALTGFLLSLLKWRPVSCTVFIASAALIVSVDVRGLPLSLNPFGVNQLYILALFYGATRTMPAWARRQGLLASLPWPVLVVLPLVMIAALPTMMMDWGSLRLRLFGSSWGYAFQVVMGAYLFYRMGHALRERLAEQAEGPTHGSTRHGSTSEMFPVFNTPELRIGLLVSIVALLDLLGRAATIG
jgi:hypothetical protein